MKSTLPITGMYKLIYCTGCGNQSRTACCGLAGANVRGLWGAWWARSVRQQFKQFCKCGVGAGWLSIAMAYRLKLTHAQSSAGDRIIQRSVLVSVSAEALFQGEKAPRWRARPDAMTPCHWVERIDESRTSSRFCGFRPPMAGFQWPLPIAFETACGPLGPENLSWWKIRLFADSAPTHTTRTTQQL